VEGMKLTSDLGEFIKELRAGDVLVYDSLSSISRLVQWADDAPANHVTIMLDESHTAMANTPHGDKFPKDIQLWDVREFIERPYIRGVLILRHPDMAADGAPARVQQRIHAYLDSAAKFSLADLVAMAPAALVRAYAQRGLNLGEPENTLVLTALSWIQGRMLRRIPDDKFRVFCSEFVYRCLLEADLHVEIDDPIVDPRSLTVGGPGSEAWGGDDMLAAAQSFWDRLRHPPSPPDPVPGMRDAADFPVRPDLVVPGDFWCSPTFERVALLTKEPPRGRAEVNTPGPEPADLIAR
jgi:hypothetical protein